MAGSSVLLLLLGVGALVGAVVLAVLAVTAGARRVAGEVGRSLAAIDQQHRGLTGGLGGRGELAGRELSPLLDRLGAMAVRLSPTAVAARLQRRLDLAGNPGRWTPERVLAYKGLGLVVGGLLGLLVGVRSPLTLLLFPVVAGAAGFFLPDVLLYNTGVKRQLAIRKALPDTLDLLTICVEAGLGFDAALDHVARSTVGPLAGECARVLTEMRLGASRVVALRALAERTTVTELSVFVSALVQASELGVPVAQVLREQAVEMRLRRRQWAEERAQKVPVKILFPLIFFLFPALLVIIIGPGALSIATSLGS